MLVSVFNSSLKWNSSNINNRMEINAMVTSSVASSYATFLSENSNSHKYKKTGKCRIGTNKKYLINQIFITVFHKTENLRSEDKILSKLWVGLIRSEGTVGFLYKCPSCSMWD